MHRVNSSNNVRAIHSKLAMLITLSIQTEHENYNPWSSMMSHDVIRSPHSIFRGRFEFLMI